MFGIGMTELVVIFAIALLVLGPKRLPALARSLGRTLAEFRRASTDLRQEFMDVSDAVKIMPDEADSNPSSTPEDGEEEDDDENLELDTVSDGEPEDHGKVAEDTSETDPPERSTSGGSRG